MSTMIRGVDFGPVWAASGACGFFGEGYWFHRLVPGLNWKGSTFVSKTTTFPPREGNMPLKRDWTPRSLFPPCVVVYPWKGHALNAIGLSGPGAVALMDDGRWQKQTKPFLLSFMSVGLGRQERFAEAKAFAILLRERLDQFNAAVGLQVNLSCPNTKNKPHDLETEAWVFLKSIREQLPTIPIIAKINVLFPVETVLKLNVDGICVSNTIPWGSCGDKIGWNTLCQSTHSPLKHLGGGGLSGAPLLPLVVEWIEQARQAGYEGHINACGGILQPNDVNVVVEAGADSVSLGSIAMLRGWRLRRTIKRAKELLK